MTRYATEALPTRFRFASGDAGASDDLAETLQGRLRAIALVIATTMLVFFVLLSVKWLNASGDARDFAQVGRTIVGVTRWTLGPSGSLARAVAHNSWVAARVGGG